MFKSSYTIHRTGQFFANLDTCDQCGADGQQAYQFWADVQVSELDDHGFILDNRYIPEAFNGWQTGKWRASCEDLAAGALLKLHATAAGRATALTVRIITNGDSWIEAAWREGEELPQRKPIRLATRGLSPREEELAVML